ncbi:hypothetical protein E9840_08230 [Tissierella creatinini]|nr:hypothetical protein E9840_08230 [Tissierella creatinini]TJX66649.1 hypothetical protein E8P77_07245 [Soehngenia saccharolytica]
MTEVNIQGEYDETLQKYNWTKNKMISLMEDKECLLKHKFFDLKTDYIMKIGCLEHELFDLDIKIAVTKRKIELAQESISQNTAINLYMIETEIKKEFSDFLDVLDMNTNEIEIANYFDSMSRLSDEDLQDLKKYYVAIAQLILPEIEPGLNQVQKSLWTKAQSAYENAELEFLKIIYKLAQDEAKAINHKVGISARELGEQIGIFEKRIMEDEKVIATLLDNFPFNKADLLNDDKKVREIQGELRRSIKDGISILELMEEHFLMMLDDTKFKN